jgi:hypothetical protein
MDSEFASDSNEGDRFFTSSSRSRLGNVLAAGLLPGPTVKDFSHSATGTFGQRFGCVTDRFRGIRMHLKMFVLSASAVALWLAPLSALDKKVNWHKAVQGVSLCAGIACAIKAGSIACKLSESAEIEVIKERAITADVIDEISTSADVSQQQRQQEAELILASSAEVEAGREALEALWESDVEAPTATAITSEKDTSELQLWWKVEAAQVEGKSATWIIENLLGKKGRKFAEGKAMLAELLKKFGGG